MDFAYEMNHYSTKEDDEHEVLLDSKIRARKSIYFDPIGEHLINLRRFQCDVEDAIKENTEEVDGQIVLQKRRGKNPAYLPEMPFPIYPKRYPFSKTFEKYCRKRSNLEVEFKGRLSDSEVESQMAFSIRRIVAQTGFSVVEVEEGVIPIQHLTRAADKFLRNIILQIDSNIPSKAPTTRKHLWNALEKTLCDGGFDGIDGLHKFYYEHIVEKHDRQLEKCLKIQHDYELLREKLNKVPVKSVPKKSKK